ncbi:PTS glucose transporter subunit IIA [Peptostreptococcus russellii]|uniref:PTS system, beta-glucosides-specific IIC component n=1 Tax=Peptostreptococcus russellii TaxID=215200 RepID=A0A1H8JUG8_9FIRM|nr:PTS glucose transporter subunit IIA [Peptostreptococcus russellii]MBC2578581.1 PTS glucose transporter subunit IIA [Peptostreptococcus russellii]SEN83838.1 PTS system, beta-glucosides-specific IIC component [Peptostreptococcus russellii]
MFKGLKDLLEKEETSKIVLKSPFRGKLLPLYKVPDPQFSDELLGKGAAVMPSQGYAAAPIDGTIINVFKGKNAFNMLSETGEEILVHIGLDTTKLHGEHFELLVEKNQTVKQGDKVIKFNLEKLVELGYNMCSPVVVSNSVEYEYVAALEEREVDYDDDIIEIRR